LEAFLFAHGEPLPLKELSHAAAMGEGLTQQILEVMAVDYVANPDQGIMLIQNAGCWQLVTKPELAPRLAEILPKQDGYRITTAMLETLALIACRQPVTRADLEMLRGVNCDGILRKLQNLELVSECGRRGRLTLYGTTQRFLHHFGLDTPQDLMNALEV